MSKLIAETGKCKLKGNNFPVRIYATDAGRNCDQIHGAYKNSQGWDSITWEEDGFFKGGNDSFSLVPIPQSYYFNVYESTEPGALKIWKSEFFRSLDDIHNNKKPLIFSRLTTYKYTGGEIEKVEEE